MIDRRPGADRDLHRRRRRRQGRLLRRATTTSCWRSAAAATTAPGSGPVDDGVVLDLSGLKDIEVDPGARTVRVGGGCLWGEVDAATNEHGLATPSGIISTTGVGGLTLGGGIGHLTRKCGLTIDNLIEADVVLASGERVRAAADENPDLLLGDPGRRRQLRRRHLLPLPTARGRHDRRRPDLLAGRGRAPRC